jgi:hypothetical protein
MSTAFPAAYATDVSIHFMSTLPSFPKTVLLVSVHDIPMVPKKKKKIPPKRAMTTGLVGLSDHSSFEAANESRRSSWHVAMSF